MPPQGRAGRGAVTNPGVRFEAQERVAFDDGWATLAQEVGDLHVGELPRLDTTLIRDSTRSVISWNTSPDIGFDRAVNPYRGCEHGCIYCYARPTHAYLGYSPGLDFETKLIFKPEVAELLEKELRKPGYVARTLALGSNTDPVPAGRAHAEADPVGAGGAGSFQSSGGHRHQVRRRAARPRHPVVDGAPQPGAGAYLGHHAGQPPRPRDGATRRDSGPPPARDRGTDAGWRAHRRARRADDPGAQRRGNGADRRSRRPRRRHAMPATSCCACRWNCARCSRRG